MARMKKVRLFFKGLKNGMKYFGENISTLINSILLTFVYVFGVGLTSVIAKLVGKHFLKTGLNSKNSKQSYWGELNLKKKPIEKYYRSF